MQHLNINIVRSEALFVSTLQRSDNPGAGQVEQAIARAVREYGSRECAARVAQEFGDHPEIAVARMRWARHVVEKAFGPNRPAAIGTRPYASGGMAHAA
jgi:alkylhydroperoxidase family enzyme